MKHLALLLLTLLLTSGLQAQTRKLQHRPYIDHRKFHYGFLLGLHMQDLEVTNNGYIDPTTGEQWYAEVDKYAPGFSVGVLGEWRLNQYLALRIQPTIHFGQKHLVFREQTTARDTTQNMRSAYISTHVGVKFSAPRFNNYRPYLIMGVAPMLDLTPERQGILLTKVFDSQLEIGFGCDFYFHYFKFIPELKFGFGLADILQKNRSGLTNKPLEKFTHSIDQARSKMITLTFYFE